MKLIFTLALFMTLAFQTQAQSSIFHGGCSDAGYPLREPMRSLWVPHAAGDLYSNNAVWATRLRIENTSNQVLAVKAVIALNNDPQANQNPNALPKVCIVIQPRTTFTSENFIVEAFGQKSEFGVLGLWHNKTNFTPKIEFLTYDTNQQNPQQGTPNQVTDIGNIIAGGQTQETLWGIKNGSGGARSMLGIAPACAGQFRLEFDNGQSSDFYLQQFEFILFDLAQGFTTQSGDTIHGNFNQNVRATVTRLGSCNAFFIYGLNVNQSNNNVEYLPAF